jgi:two-component system LytT family response regulator
MPIPAVRTIIVDDEKKARETISGILRMYCENAVLVAEAENVSSAIEAIERHKPDLVLLDINMPGGNGFELLRHFSKADFKIVFITAYEEFAIKAFKFSALDYILKPVDPDELVAAVEKVKGLIEKESMDTKLKAFIDNMDNISREVKKIVLKTSESIHVLNVHEIIRCEADRNYTSFILSSGKKILVSNTLKEYDEMLSSYRFFRAHQSHLVNIDHIERYEKKEGGFLIMKDRSFVPVSVRKKETLLSLLENI